LIGQISDLTPFVMMFVLSRMGKYEWRLAALIVGAAPNVQIPVTAASGSFATHLGPHGIMDRAQLRPKGLAVVCLKPIQLLSRERNARALVEIAVPWCGAAGASKCHFRFIPSSKNLGVRPTARRR
jgi:hypothetical protein